MGESKNNLKFHEGSWWGQGFGDPRMWSLRIKMTWWHLGNQSINHWHNWKLFKWLMENNTTEVNTASWRPPRTASSCQVCTWYATWINSHSVICLQPSAKSSWNENKMAQKSIIRKAPNCMSSWHTLSIYYMKQAIDFLKQLCIMRAKDDSHNRGTGTSGN